MILGCRLLLQLDFRRGAPVDRADERMLSPRCYAQDIVSLSVWPVSIVETNERRRRLGWRLTLSSVIQ